ncbi:hypothetical protein XBO1_1240081 [Xenorhabdus bovienii str. oregonense]|uniref:Uncharacterized protein n=1 Tax=Xenorhabdus bovienii str. oregonense TaxID=1398202 RepID=A0A077P026_XENBV|nr:hypothetical protein [Xenorhabdus bovienii]CDH04380.1 hypothetical protein XBO1_1240081 [Xenorhabdus bovienii str. oregonense]
MLFSVQYQGFYVGDHLDMHVLPNDCVPVSAKQMAEIHKLVIAGFVITAINGDALVTKKRNEK